MQKEETKKAIDAVTQYFTKNEGAKAAVVKLPIGGNAKVLPEVVKHVQSKMKDKTVYVIAADEKGVEDGKVVHGCVVSEVSHVTTYSQ